MSCTDDKWLESQSWGIWLWSGAGGVFCEEGTLKTVGKRVRCEGTHRTGTTAGGQGLCPPRLELALQLTRPWRTGVCTLASSSCPSRPSFWTHRSPVSDSAAQAWVVMFLTLPFWPPATLMPWPRTTERAAEMQSEGRGGAPVFYSHTTFPFFLCIDKFF